LHYIENKPMLGVMSIAESEAQTARRQLERVLASSGFARNERMARFLRFVVEQHLAGKDSELKESTIAIEVFERRPDHDLTRDSLVRTEAGRLRARLLEYYTGEGKDDPLVIELPKGGYVPVLLPVATAPATTHLEQKGQPRLLMTLALLGIIAALGVGAWWRVLSSTLPIGIAVLPFENLNHQAADDYFADGLTDELIRNLSAFDGLAPRSRTSSFALKGKPRNIRQAGRELAADYIVEGSVLRSGERLRINASLVRTRDDFPVWSNTFERPASDALTIQNEISRSIANSLRVKLGRGRRRYEASTEAYDLYLRARAAGLRDSGGLFQQAIAKDPSFAPAYAGLASSYAYRTGNTFNDANGELPKMRAAAEKAIELDPLLAEAHSAVGMAYARDGQWALSEASFRRAIEIDRNRSESYGDFAVYVLMQQGRIREALHEMRIAQKSDPLSAEVRSQLANVLLSSHLYDEAASECEKLPEDCRCWPAPSEPVRYECLGRARLGQGRLREAVEILAAGVAKGVPIGAPIRGYLGYAYGRVGRYDEAEKIVELAVAFPYHQAVALTGMGDRDRAIAALEKLVPTGPVRVGLALAVPEFDTLRSDSRFKALRQVAGLQ
jgi:TolB-like protein/Flp pilus assembly protein TadD